MSKVKALSERLIVVKGNDPLSEEAQRNATIMFMSLLRSTLASKRCLAEFKLTPEAFDWLIGEIDTRFNAVSYSLCCFKCFSACEWVIDGCADIKHLGFERTTACCFVGTNPQL